MKLIIGFLLLLISTLFSPSCLSSPKVIQPDPSFQMVIADGWELIDSEAISIFNGMRGRSGRQYYNFGIQRIKSKHAFDYPYVLVQIKNDGKYPTAEELKALREGNSFDLFDVKKYEKLIKNEFYFDHFQNSIFMVIEKKDYDGSPLYGLIVSHLTKNGRISVICYYKKSQIKKYISELGFMAATVLIDSQYKYNEK